MKDNITVKEITETVANASTNFELANTELKRKYLEWNISAFNIIAKRVTVGKGTFGTGYPFYVLDKNLKGKMPIINEQKKYNRQLVLDGTRYAKEIWKCQSCIKTKYANMPDLKKICKPCPITANSIKPRKIINRLPDLDMWLVCEDGKVSEAEKQLSELLNQYKMFTSDKDPLLAIDNVVKISRSIKYNKKTQIYLPIDTHIIEYSELKRLIEEVPEVLSYSYESGEIPYLPIQPKSLRKQWQYDDEAYNFIYDFLSAFSEFNFPEELKKSLDTSRAKIVKQFTSEELFDALMGAATEANFRRFQTTGLEKIFLNKMEEWKKININNYNKSIGTDDNEPSL